MSNSNKLGLLFAGLATVSVFLPWAEGNASASMGSLGSYSASTGGISGISLGVGITGLLLGLGALYSSFKRMKFTWILGLVMLVDGIYYLLTMNSAGASGSYSAGGYSASASSSVDPQAGIFLFAASALLLTIFTLKDRKG
jgi:hypothetical protein